MAQPKKYAIALLRYCPPSPLPTYDTIEKVIACASIDMAPRVEELFLRIPLVLSIGASWERSLHEKIVLIISLEHR